MNPDLKALKRPFDINEVKWVVSHSTDKRIFFVPYIEKGQVVERFDNCIGNWSCQQTYLTGPYMKCTIGFTDDNGNRLSRDGVGQGDAGDLKAAETDSIKRAARLFGVGEFHLKVAWPGVKSVPNGKGGNKKVPTDAGDNALYGESVNEAIRIHLKGANVSPHNDKIHWVNFNEGNRPKQQRPASPPAQTPGTSTMTVDVAKKFIESSESPGDFKTSYDGFKGMKGTGVSYPILVALWGDRLLAKAEGATYDDVVAFGKMAAGCLGKENGYVANLRGKAEAIKPVTA